MLWRAVRVAAGVVDAAVFGGAFAARRREREVIARFEAEQPRDFDEASARWPELVGTARCVDCLRTTPSIMTFPLRTWSFLPDGWTSWNEEGPGRRVRDWGVARARCGGCNARREHPGL